MEHNKKQIQSTASLGKCRVRAWNGTKSRAGTNCGIVAIVAMVAIKTIINCFVTLKRTLCLKNIRIYILRKLIAWDNYIVIVTLKINLSGQSKPK